MFRKKKILPGDLITFDYVEIGCNMETQITYKLEFSTMLNRYCLHSRQQNRAAYGFSYGCIAKSNSDFSSKESTRVLRFQTR